MPTVLILFLFIANISFSQNTNDSIYVYPLKRSLPNKFNYYNTFRDYMTTPTTSTIPCVGCKRFAVEANDGKYVMHYEGDKKIPYSIFELKDHKMNGEAVYFSPTGDTIAFGTFKNDRQIGEWMVRRPFYKVPFKSNEYGRLTQDTVKWCTYFITITNNTLDGAFSYYEGNKLKTKGFLKQGQPIGAWSIYHDNGQIANKFNILYHPVHLDKDSIVLYSSLSLIDKNHPKFSPFPPPSEDLLPYGNSNATLIGLDHDLINEYNSFNEETIEEDGTISYVLKDQNEEIYSISNFGTYEIKSGLKHTETDI